MKKLTVILFLLLFALAVCANAEKKSENSLLYDQSVTYKGMFKSTQMFNRYERTKNWFPNKELKVLKEVSCGEARMALQRKGIWTGNLSDDGQCQDPGEAPQWATGNYLNFLSEKAQKSKQLPIKRD